MVGGCNSNNDNAVEETNAIVISMVWDTNGYENDCAPQFLMNYDSTSVVNDDYGCGTGYYDEDGNLVLVDYYEKQDTKVYDTILVYADNGVSITLEPTGPSNDSPVQSAIIQITDVQGVRTLNNEDIYTRGDTGIWYDKICTVKNGLAEDYEY